MNKIFFLSLGCDKNLVDTEFMIGSLDLRRFQVTDNEAEADVIVINTCAFILDAKDESVENILKMAEYKDRGSCKALIVTGCLSSQYKDDIQKEIPQVDGVIVSGANDELPFVIDRALKGEKSFISKSEKREGKSKRVLSTPGYFEYLKIAEGCNKNCTYCIIPRLRGSYVSTPMEELLDQAKYLADMGVKELNIIAQETTMYGIDLYGKKTLHVLLRRLCEIPGLKWIRVLYAYPEEIYDELIDTIRDEDKICNYLDMPIQHCNDRILKLMGRKTTKAELINKIALLREKIPGIALRTTLISGFPTETDMEHRELLEFIKEEKFQHLGVFAYSKEEETKAGEMEGQIPQEIKEKRRDQLMMQQQEISLNCYKEKIGSTTSVLVEGFLPEEGVYVGRSYMDAPNVDGMVFFEAANKYNSGDFVKVKITKASEYDCIGEII